MGPSRWALVFIKMRNSESSVKRAVFLSACLILFVIWFRSMRSREWTTAGQDAVTGKERELLPDSTTSLSSLAKALVTEGRDPLLVTFINNAHVSMANNWLCHTRHLGGVHDRLIVVAMDEESKRQLQHQWPHLNLITPSLANVSFRGILKFGTVGYIRLMAERVQLLYQLIQTGLSFILLETDFVWYEHPLPDFPALAESSGADLIGTRSDVRSQIMCGGFIYFRNTVRTRELFQEVLRRMQMLEVRLEGQGNEELTDGKENEQRYMNYLLKTKWKGIRYALVDYRRTVMDGRWYKMAADRRFNPRPKAVHNNFLPSGPRKVTRFKAFSQWVLTRDGSCDERKVTRLLQQRD